MNGVIVVALPMLAFTGALMFLLPYFSPLRYFFAITVPLDFHSTETARSIVRRYHAHLLIVIALSIAAVLLIAPSFPELAVVLANLLPIIGGMFCFLRARNDVRHYAAPVPQVREAELSTASDHLPRWIAWALPPFAVPPIIAAYLRTHWGQIPARFPVHFDFEGKPNGWVEKSVVGVYMPLLIEAGLMLLILLLSITMFYGSRRGPQRSAVLKILIAVLYFIAYIFTTVALLPLIQFPVLALLGPSALFTIGILVWSLKKARDPDVPVDNTPDRYWHLGDIYYNPDDPALFVQRRIGFGYTFNFANRLSWVSMGVLLLVIGGLLFAVSYK